MITFDFLNSFVFKHTLYVDLISLLHLLRRPVFIFFCETVEVGNRSVLTRHCTLRPWIETPTQYFPRHINNERIMHPVKLVTLIAMHPVNPTRTMHVYTPVGQENDGGGDAHEES